MKGDPPLKGDLIEVHWVDIAEDSSGTPNEASLARRVSVAYYWEEKLDKGIPVLVTTTTIEKDEVTNSGYCIYPFACVTQLRVIRRKRRKKEKNGSSVA